VLQVVSAEVGKLIVVAGGTAGGEPLLYSTQNCRVFENHAINMAGGE
jgi:hypothetical protein